MTTTPAIENKHSTKGERSTDWLVVGAAAFTVRGLGVGVRRHPVRRPRRTRPARSASAGSRRLGLPEPDDAVGRPLGADEPARLGAGGADRRALVRRLQRRAERRRAARRRRHRGHADPARAHPDRRARRPAARRGIPADAGDRRTGGLRRHADHRHRHQHRARRHRRRAAGAARGGRLRDRGGGAEGRAAPDPRPAGDLAGLPDRHRRLPAVPAGSLVTRLAAQPAPADLGIVYLGRGADRAGLPDLGLRAEPRPRPGGSGRPPTPSRRSRSCWAGSSSARCRRCWPSSAGCLAGRRGHRPPPGQTRPLRSPDRSWP